MGYFMKWYSTLSKVEKDDIKTLIKRKQIELINGGYAMNDEACTYYDQIILQYHVGHRWIREEFGYVARAAWAIDPFGHSTSQASLLSQIGYNGFFIERVHFEEMRRRAKSKAMEFIWGQEEKFLFTSITPHKYSSFEGFECEQINCGKTIDGNSMKKFASMVQEKAQEYATSNFLWHIGNDFSYSYDTLNPVCESLKIMRTWFSDHPEFNIRLNFSNVETYLWYANQESLRNTEKQFFYQEDDFFPYMEDPVSPWTGYFASKPLFKGFVFESMRYYNAMRNFLSKFLLRSQGPYRPIDSEYLEYYDMIMIELEKELSLLSHHDAVTGTSSKGVTVDYMNRVQLQTTRINEELFIIFREYFKFHHGLLLNKIERYSLFPSNIKHLNLQKKHNDNGFMLVVYNPSDASSRLVNFKYPSSNISIIDESGLTYFPDIFCDYPNSDSMSKNCEIFFFDWLPGFTFKTYFINMINKNLEIASSKLTKDHVILLSNGSEISIDTTGRTINYKICSHTNSCLTESFELSYKYYESSTTKNKSSGCYLFIPADFSSKDYGKIIDVEVAEGSKIVQFKISRNTVTSKIRISKEFGVQLGIEVESFINPVSIQDNIGKEIILEISSKLNNCQSDYVTSGECQDTMFFTDSNGLKMQKRVLNHKYGKIFSKPIEIGFNYYPVTSAIYIEDKITAKRITVLNDRAQGGSSEKEGKIELMIQRTPLRDDNKGLGEDCFEVDLHTGNPVNITLRHRIYLSNGVEVKHQQRAIQKEIDSPLQYFILTPATSIKNLSLQDHFQFVAGTSNKLFEEALRIDVRVMKKGEVLLRLQNTSENQVLEIPFWDDQRNEIYLLNKFCQENIKVKNLAEVTLTGHLTKKKATEGQYKWGSREMNISQESNLSAVKLKPLEMRAFYLIATGIDALKEPVLSSNL